MFPKIDYQVTMQCVQPGCEERFVKTKDLINHFREEHNPKLQCPHCNKEVKYGAGLIHHVRIHTGERPYFCPVQGCTFRSATKNNLKVHLSGKLHGWDVLMQFAHIFDRPKKKRHYSDLPDIVVKRQKSQMKGMQPMISGMGLMQPGMMIPPMMGDSSAKPPSGIPPSLNMPKGLQMPPSIPNLKLPDEIQKQLDSVMKNVDAKLPTSVDMDTVVTSAMPSILATGSPKAAAEVKTTIVSSNSETRVEIPKLI